MNARPNNNQLITYYLLVCYLLRIQQYPVNTNYNNFIYIKWKQLEKRLQTLVHLGLSGHDNLSL